MKRQITFSADPSVYKYLHLKKERSGYSVSSIINAILKEYIENNKIDLKHK